MIPAPCTAINSRPLSALLRPINSVGVGYRLGGPGSFAKARIEQQPRDCQSRPHTKTKQLYRRHRLPRSNVRRRFLLRKAGRDFASEPAHTVPSRSSNSDATKCSTELRTPGQLAAPPGYKAGIRANPESAVARNEQAVDVVCRADADPQRLPWAPSNAIEAEQTEFCAQPEISVGCLGHCIDVALEEPIPDGPCAMRVLADLQRWVQRKNTTGNKPAKLPSR